MEIKHIASSIVFTDEYDIMIWHFNSVGKYLGVSQVYTPVMWKLNIPSWVYVFLWFLDNKKRVIRDILAKRREVEDPFWFDVQ